MSLTQTFVGTLTADPELRTAGDSLVANFTIACNERKYNRDTNQWEDGATTFLDCAAWKTIGENAAENLRKGTRVIVVGRLKQENWEKEGQKRSKLKLEVDEIGPSLKFAAKGQPRQAAPAEDPWASMPSF